MVGSNYATIRVLRGGRISWTVLMQRGSLFEMRSKFERIVSGRGSTNSPRDINVRWKKDINTEVIS